MLNKPVADLNLSVRARKCMNRLGINTLGDLIQRTADELLESKNFGMTSLTEVRDKLRQYGLSLRGDRPAADCHSSFVICPLAFADGR